MCRAFLHKFISILTIGFLLGICGCVSMMENMPAPPDMFVKIELNGPYDQEIPEKFVKQLKGASFTSDWAIPYIFISVGMHFESAGDEIRAVHFFDRAITEFPRLKDSTGEGTAFGRKIFVLYEFGKIQDAYNNIKEAEKNWPNAPLNAFVYHNYGHYYLMNGDYYKALDYFHKAFQANENYRVDFNLLMLRRDTELECGIAVILADYFPAVSKKFNFLDFDEAFYKTIRKNVDSCLRPVARATADLRHTKYLNSDLTAGQLL